jgi:hypothetical protein
MADASSVTERTCTAVVTIVTAVSFQNKHSPMSTAIDHNSRRHLSINQFNREISSGTVLTPERWRVLPTTTETHIF